MANRKALLIINPRAGKMEANKHLVEIIEILCTGNIDALVKTTSCAGDGVKLVEEYAAGMDLVICVGGDGTFNETLEGVMKNGLNIPIGYIPTGSTNDFATSLGLPKDMLEAARVVAYGAPKKVDVGCFNGRHFSYVASFGAFTKASYEAPQNVKNAIGHSAYILEGVKALTAIKGENLKIEADGVCYDGEYIFGSVSNSTSVAGILTLDSKLVDMSDGKFELMLIKMPGSINECNKILFELGTKEFNSKMITFVNAKEIKISGDETMDWTLDGEYQKGAEEVFIQNLHEAVEVFLPRE